ncbi:solute carrier family 28 member 3-like isoform X1 [Portunus trituberculatus]|uniref:solute carrier family 28 member 3-like isoform X1 n=1 Tax=Portunus trituberculatus TaxID=210409 RepID=UPI001E1CBB50|nr:solute carrier family 28 member 3-like isoform X1 [Portunus trituberculatus]XP_045133391.1 solute carrier family 28 member 3-like isoform X1 [Portunus trituberculatus]
MNSTSEEATSSSLQNGDCVEMQGKDNPSFAPHAEDEGKDGGARSRSSVVNINAECSDDEEDEMHENFLTMLPFVDNFKKKMTQFPKWKACLLSITLAAAYVAYVIAILVIQTKAEESNYWCDADGLVIIITAILFLGLFYFLVVKHFWGKMLYHNVVRPVNSFTDKVLAHKWVPWVFFLVLVVGALVFIGVDSRHNMQRLQSLLGVVVLLLFGFIFSVAPKKVRWRHVAWGMALQFILGLIILRWPFGRSVFECLAGKVATFLAFTDEGAGFVFGDLATVDRIFAFSVLPVILFFSFCVQILYYYGVMQWVVIKMGWFLQVTIGTTACESVNAAANIFLGQTEAPLLIKPFIPQMTKSELHAVLTGGFATVAGSVMAAYISFGVNPAHLLSASVMSAPAALAFSKLFYPETRKSKTNVKNIQIAKGEEANLLHAAMVGVTNAIPLVANIAANLVAFYAFIAFGSHVFDWTCTLAGAEEGTCSIESLFGWIFMPLAWVMGVDWAECDKVGQLIGLKTILNEFVAYEKLSEMLKAEELSVRAEVIATYALCGFSNISSIGINLGGFGAMAPNRKVDLAKVVLRAMIAGSCACFLTACIAGTLLDDVGRGSR